MDADFPDKFGKCIGPELDSGETEECCGEHVVSTAAYENYTSMVKEKPNTTRVYDQEGFRRRAACICVKNELENEMNKKSKHRTEVFVLVVTEELPEWEDLKSKGRKRKWFTIEDALEQLSLYKPCQLAYLQSLLTCHNDKVT